MKETFEGVLGENRELRCPVAGGWVWCRGVLTMLAGSGSGRRQ